MGLSPMVCLMIEQVHEDIGSAVLEELAGSVCIPLPAIEQGLVKRSDIADDPIVLVGACQRQLAAYLVNDGIETIGVLAFAGQSLKPDAIGQQYMIEGSVHAFEESTHVAPIVQFDECEARS